MILQVEFWFWRWVCPEITPCTNYGTFSFAFDTRFILFISFSHLCWFLVFIEELPLVANKLSEVVAALQKTADKLTAIMPSTPSNFSPRTPSNTGSNVNNAPSTPSNTASNFNCAPSASGQSTPSNTASNFHYVPKTFGLSTPSNTASNFNYAPSASDQSTPSNTASNFQSGPSCPSKLSTPTSDVIKCSELDGYGVSILKTLLDSCFLDMTKSNKLHIYVVASSKLWYHSFVSYISDIVILTFIFFQD